MLQCELAFAPRREVGNPPRLLPSKKLLGRLRFGL